MGASKRDFERDEQYEADRLESFEQQIEDWRNDPASAVEWDEWQASVAKANTEKAQNQDNQPPRAA